MALQATSTLASCSVKGGSMAKNPKERFVQPASGVVIVSSPVLTEEQIVEIELNRRVAVKEEKEDD